MKCVSARLLVTLLTLGLAPLACVQDGQEVRPSERIAAQQLLPALHQQLLQELTAEGIDPTAAAQVEDDSIWEEGEEVPETGYVWRRRRRRGHPCVLCRPNRRTIVEHA